jgi:hypothetical protein
MSNKEFNQDELNKALVKACKDGDITKVQLCLNCGADIHFSRNYALYKAAKHGHFDIVKRLVEADPKRFNNKGEAIEIAAERGHYEIANYLIYYDQIEHPDTSICYRLPRDIDIRRMTDSDGRKYFELIDPET